MWYPSENRSFRPDTLDTTSSKVYNYIRKNIEEYTDPETGNPYWKYLEQKIPKDQYELYEQTQQTQADLDYLSMMTDIPL